MNKNLYEALVTISQLPVDGSIINAIGIAKTALTEPTKPSEYVPLTDDEELEYLCETLVDNAMNAKTPIEMKGIIETALYHGHMAKELNSISKLSEPVNTVSDESIWVERLCTVYEIESKLHGFSCDTSLDMVRKELPLYKKPQAANVDELVKAINEYISIMDKRRIHYGILSLETESIYEKSKQALAKFKGEK
jgi:hypothetical protein